VTDARLSIEYMPLASLEGAPRNPKDHAEQLLAASMDRWGFVEPIVLDERTGRIVAGHGRRDELRRREADEKALLPDFVVEDDDGTWLAPVVRGWASENDEEAEGYVVASNRIGEVGGWQPTPLWEMLRDLAVTPGGLDGVGYTLADLDALSAIAGDPASLDALAGRLGKSDEHDFWPVVRLVIAPPLHERWMALWENFGGDDADDSARMEALLDALDEWAGGAE
jgi:hypothetical protein